MRTVLTEGGRARPYMSVRMPQFGEAHVGLLAAALAQMDGVVPGSDSGEPAAHSDELVMAGRRLAGEHGLSCFTCHSWAGKAGPTGPGPDMADFAERIRYDWYRTYLMVPGRFKPGTKMSALNRLRPTLSLESSCRTAQRPEPSGKMGASRSGHSVRRYSAQGAAMARIK
jgi:hypothetical protein